MQRPLGLLTGRERPPLSEGGVSVHKYVFFQPVHGLPHQGVGQGGVDADAVAVAEARAALQAVTKDDVRAILRKLTLSVSYLLTKEVAAHAAE